MSLFGFERDPPSNYPSTGRNKSQGKGFSTLVVTLPLKGLCVIGGASPMGRFVGSSQTGTQTLYPLSLG